MDTEEVYLISDDSDVEDSSSTRRKADEQDPLEGKRILRKKKPKVRNLKFQIREIIRNAILNFCRLQIENEQKKDSMPSTSDKKDDEVADVKKPEIEVPHDEPQPNDILTTLEGACFQSRFPYDKMTT